MESVGKMISYLNSESFQRRAREEGERPFITISRQAGAGGTLLARELLAAMDREADPLWSGWRSYDKEICGIVAEDPRLCASLESMRRERFRGPVEDYLTQFIAGEAPQAAVLRRVFRVVRGLAAAGKAVIIGRAGSCVTRDLSAGVHVRLVASRGARVSRLMDLLALNRPEAERRLRELDESRARLVKSYFKRDIEDPLLYDAVWNTDCVPIPAVARQVLGLLRERLKLQAAELAAG